MVKLVIFDLDGVLVEAKEIHYRALNKALEVSDYEGLKVEREKAKSDGK